MEWHSGFSASFERFDVIKTMHKCERYQHDGFRLQEIPSDVGITGNDSSRVDRVEGGTADGQVCYCNQSSDTIGTRKDLILFVCLPCAEARQ